jgi:DNA-binding response OmpR family regulator
MKPVVVVADDDEDILALLAFRLEREGYDVLPARDGAHALALTRERHPAVAVLDVAMPGLDGLEVARAIRADGLDTRVVLLTARAAEQDVRRGLAAGADGYITKPFSPAHLGWRLAELLG